VDGQERLLLGSNFLPYLREPTYLLTHLDVCSAIARTVPVHTVAVPAGRDALALANAVATHARAAA
jgi:hypothetical protein